MRLRSTLPAVVGNGPSGYFAPKLDPLPVFTVNTSLINNEICEEENIQFNFAPNNNRYKFLKNGQTEFDYQFISTYSIKSALK
ncbi:MAG: hypothetical protein R2852_07905 [Bacteroidia bacterium]